jgi:hypothetical protein
VARTPVRRLIERGIEAGADYIPDVIETPLRKAFSIGVPKSKASKPKASLAVNPKALPAPPKQLALPAPGPGLPPLASKPRGGQFWVDKDLPVFENNTSPEAVARRQAGDVGYRFLNNDDIAAQLSTDAPVPFSPEAFSTQDWLARALAKYYKTDFGSPDDPLRDLAERGLHYDPDMTPEKWKATVDSYLLEDPIGDIMFPPNRAGGMPGAGSNMRGGALSAMPWLAKQPVTDKVYGIGGGGLDLEHFADEFANALNPEASGLPFDLAVRPGSLGRMTFPQAVEQVGKINQFRAKEMERAALSNLDSPAVQTFKEYTENNPMGLRWTELKAPEGAITPNRAALAQNSDDWLDPGYVALRDALKYEGDTMGHCVGGYCDDVMEGRSRIFSLRDAKGEPHVTIETAPYTQWLSLEHAADTDQDFGDAWNQWRYGYDISRAPGRPEGTFEDYLRENDPDLLSRFEEQSYAPDEIVQIKGKQNRAPKDDYLPFVQDFVKSQQWGNVGDFKNTGLVKLPDGRYITDAQYREGALKASTDIDYLFDPYANKYRLPDEDWDALRPYFEGYAVGGRVCANRCFSKGKSAVYAVNKSRK